MNFGFGNIAGRVAKNINTPGQFIAQISEVVAPTGNEEDDEEWYEEDDEYEEEDDEESYEGDEEEEEEEEDSYEDEEEYDFENGEESGGGGMLEMFSNTIDRNLSLVKDVITPPISQRSFGNGFRSDDHNNEALRITAGESSSELPSSEKKTLGESSTELSEMHRFIQQQQQLMREREVEEAEMESGDRSRDFSESTPQIIQSNSATYTVASSENEQIILAASETMTSVNNAASSNKVPSNDFDENESRNLNSEKTPSKPLDDTHELEKDVQSETAEKTSEMSLKSENPEIQRNPIENTITHITYENGHNEESDVNNTEEKNIFLDSTNNVELSNFEKCLIETKQSLTPITPKEKTTSLSSKTEKNDIVKDSELEKDSVSNASIKNNSPQEMEKAVKVVVPSQQQTVEQTYQGSVDKIEAQQNSPDHTQSYPVDTNTLEEETSIKKSVANNSQIQLNVATKASVIPQNEEENLKLKEQIETLQSQLSQKSADNMNLLQAEEGLLKQIKLLKEEMTTNQEQNQQIFLNLQTKYEKEQEKQKEYHQKEIYKLQKQHNDTILTQQKLQNMTMKENDKKRNEILSKVDEKELEVSQLKNVISDMRKLVTGSNDRTVAAEKHLENVRNERGGLELIVKELKEENTILEEKVRGLLQEKEKLNGVHMELNMLKEARDRDRVEIQSTVESASNTNVKIASERDAARARVKDLEQQLKASQADLELVTSDYQRSVTSCENLQKALEAFQIEHDAEISLLEEQRKRFEANLSVSAEANLAAVREQNEVKMREVQQASDMAVRNCMEEIKTLEQRESKLKEECQNLRKSLNEAISRLQMSQEDVVDRSLMKNILLDWHKKRGTAKLEVLKLMASVLHFTEDEKDDIGIGVVGVRYDQAGRLIEGEKNRFGKIVEAVAAPLPKPALNINKIEGGNVREKWVNFLLAECGDMDS